MGTILQFCPLQSKVDVTFWSALGDLKLHKLKLQEGPVSLRAFWAPSNHVELPGLLTVSAESLPGLDAADEDEDRAAAAPLGFQACGDLHVLNTEERIVSFDRKAAVAEVCSRVWAAIESGAAEQDPSLLLSPLLLAYCDLKHYKYRYWFSFPALQPPQPFTLEQPPASLQQALGELATAVGAACSDWAASSSQPAWLVSIEGSSVQAASLGDWQRLHQRPDSTSSGDFDADRQVWLAVCDSSNLAEHPGWPLRNLLLLAAARWGCRRLNVLCLRERRGRFDPTASLALAVSLPEVPAGFSPAPLGGWEANERGRVGPRLADLGPSMDPRQLAEAAVDLNLRLMRWRAAPSLDVGAIAAARCLLLGAGTLGCSVARTLLGWGVRRITLVDNSRVAYSNPVRQSLYTFEDCLHGGQPKAAAAAAALARVFPGVSARGLQLSIPMPGHPISEAEVPQVRQDLSVLEGLVAGHDVVFLLMDTRESRWLPTLLCASMGRLAINAALGFDGYVVMRHGAPVPLPEGGTQAQQQGEAGGAADAAAGMQAADAAAAEGGEQQRGADAPDGSSSSQPQPSSAAATPAAGGGSGAPAGGGRLGCYFCNDVVAPLNSTIDRTLDQQCTVARPGLSAIAGSLAVELMAAVLQHPAGAAAPAAGSPAAVAAAAAGAEEPPLGDPPHMVRGQLGAFSQLCLSGQAFRQCTACSEAVVAEYRRRGHDFLLQGLLDPKYLEDLTGLTELHQASEAALEAWASSDEEEEGRAGQGGPEGGGSRRGEGAAAAAAGGSSSGEDWEEL